MLGVARKTEKFCTLVISFSVLGGGRQVKGSPQESGSEGTRESVSHHNWEVGAYHGTLGTTVPRLGKLLRSTVCDKCNLPPFQPNLELVLTSKMGVQGTTSKHALHHQILYVNAAFGPIFFIYFILKTLSLIYFMYKTPFTFFCLWLYCQTKL